MNLSGASKLISQLADKVSSLFPPSEDGKIKTGSPNTHINNLPAARAAGIITKPEETADEQPQQPANFIDMAANILGGLWHIAKEMARPTVAAPDPHAVPQNNDKITCKKTPILLC